MSLKASPEIIKQARALRARGLTYRSIADNLGYTNAWAWKHCHDGRDVGRDEELRAEQLRKIAQWEVQRLSVREMSRRLRYGYDTVALWRRQLLRERPELARGGKKQRTKEVAELLTAGYGFAAIARELGLSIKSVPTYQTLARKQGLIPYHYAGEKEWAKTMINRGWTQTKIARELGVNRLTIHRWRKDGII